METDKLTRLFQQTRELPPEVSFKTIEKLVMLQPAVPVAAKVTTLWWKSKFFLNSVTATIITGSAAGVIYYNAGSDKKITQQKEPVPQQQIVEAIPPSLSPNEETLEPPPAVPENPAPEPPSAPGTEELTPYDAYEPEISVAEESGGDASGDGASVGNGYSYSYSDDGATASSGGDNEVIYSHNQDNNGSKSCAHCSSTDSLWDCIEKELSDDRLINISKGYHFEMKPGVLYIDGKKMDERYASKYQKLYEKLADQTLSTHFHIDVRIDKKRNSTSVSTSVNN